MRRIAMPVTAPTLTPGTLNRHGQEVLARTGKPSRQRAGQVVYRLRCTGCAFEYGCAGLDVRARRCPGCQGGAQAEPLVERGVALFEV